MTALRETVQAAAADLELTLLRKGASVTPGSPDEVMQQLNEGRVLAASVPVWEPPQLGDGEMGWGFGGDGADLNRQSALHLLRHPTLLDEPDKVHERVREALLAPDFRPADLGKCTRLLWWQIAVTPDLQDSSTIWGRYWERWTALCEGHAWSPAFKERGYDWLFAVEGLDQLLDRVAWFEHNKSAEWIQMHRAGLSRLAKAVAHGDSAEAGFFKHAANSGGVNEAHLRRRMRLVWWKAKQQQPDIALTMTAPQQVDKPTPVQWFCHAASLLATATGREPHPLMKLTSQPPVFSGGEFPRSIALHALLREKQDNQSTSEVLPVDRLAALDMVISASKPSVRLAVLAKFPDLLQGDKESVPIPLPPIPGIQSTLLAYESVHDPKGINLVAYANGEHAPPDNFYGCTLGQSGQGTLPAPLAPGWGTPETFHEQLRRWKAAGALPVLVRDDSKPFHVITGGARFAADMVDLLLAIQQQDGDNKELVPVVAHLAQKVQGPEQTWFLLGEPLSPDVLGASAWVRDSKGFLRTVGVPQAFARYWRVGCAVSDMMGVAQDIPCEGDTAENDAPPGGLHELEEYVIRQQLRKLRGKWISEAQVQHLDKEGMPTSARRALETLRGFPSGAEPKMQVLALLVTEAETRSMAMRLEQAGAGGLRSALHRLPLQVLRRFPKEGASKAEEIVAADLEALGQHLSISHDLGSPRRSILLVPAATSRTCDYWYAGQASVLASGTATVFCNAVAGRLFQGGSCFIGADSTAREKEHAGMITVLTPYHGWQKGALLGGNGGALSSNDQALVVADLDPVHVVGGRPRPQLLAPPLSLVAYLPVVELLDRGKNSKGLSAALIKEHFIKDVDVDAPLQHVCLDMSEPKETSLASFRDAYRDLAGLVQADAPVQGQKLDAFANSFSDPESLRKRLLCWGRDRHQQPHAGQHAKRPPPALVDFLAVDLTLTLGQDIATVGVPAWSREAGALSEERESDSE